jgi:hypothetical protein
MELTIVVNIQYTYRCVWFYQCFSSNLCFFLIKNQQVSPISKSNEYRRKEKKGKWKKIESRKNISTKTTYVFTLMDWINNKCECIYKVWVNKWMNDIRTLSFLSFFSSSSSSAIARILYVHMTMCVCERKNGSCYSFRIGSSIRIYAGISINIRTHDRKETFITEEKMYIISFFFFFCLYWK